MRPLVLGALGVLGLAVTGCSASVLMTRPAPLVRGEPVVFLGLDFTAAELSDPHFFAEDLVRGKIPRWNSEASDEAVSVLDELPISIDLRVSADRNASINTDARVTAPAGLDEGIPETRLWQEVAPYADPHAPGKAIVVFVERVTKRRGVAAHAIVFERATGEPLLATRSTGEGDGFGVYHFYRTALATIAGRCARAIRSRVVAAPTAAPPRKRADSDD